MAAITEAFALIVEKEKQVFEEKLYFYYLEREHNLGIPFLVVELDEDKEFKGDEAKGWAQVEVSNFIEASIKGGV